MTRFCLSCNEEFSSIAKLKQHLKITSCGLAQPMLQCPYCERDDFVDEKSLHSHLNRNRHCSKQDVDATDKVSTIFPVRKKTKYGETVGKLQEATSSFPQEQHVNNMSHIFTVNGGYLGNVVDSLFTNQIYANHTSFNVDNAVYFDSGNDPSVQKVQKTFFVHITHDKLVPGLNETTLDQASTAVDEDSTEIEFNQDDENDNSSTEEFSHHGGVSFTADSNDSVSVVMETDIAPIQNIEDIGVFDAEASTDDNQAAETTVPPNNVIWEQAQYLRRVQSNMICSPETNSLVELYNILDKRGCANSLFDTIAEWAWINSSTFGSNPPMQREKLVKAVCRSVRGKLEGHFMRPKQKALKLTSGRSVVITYFPIELMIMDLLSNNELMKTEHLLFSDIEELSNEEQPNVDDAQGVVDTDEVSNDNQLPVGDTQGEVNSVEIEELANEEQPTGGDTLGEVNSGTWWNIAKAHECTEPNEVLWPIILFIDAMKVDSQGGRLALEPVSFTFSRFHRWLRHQPNAWRTWAYIDQVTDDAHNATDTGMSIGARNVQEYHDILKFLMDQLYEIQKSGIKWVFRSAKDRREIPVVLKVPIQFIIGDCEGHDKLAGRYKGHGLNIKGLCRDCDVPTALSDDVNWSCNYFTANSIRDMNPNELKMHSFHDINNAFAKVSFGGDVHGIQGAIPPEPLHLYKLGHCEWLYDGFIYSVSQQIVDDLPSICKYFVNANRGQSDRMYPDIGTFREGLAVNGGTLRGYEKHARIFFMYLLLTCSDFVRHLTQNKKRGSTYDLRFYRRFIALIEASLGFYEWWVLREHAIETIRDNNGTVALSNAQKSIVKYLTMMKKRCPREEFGKSWKMPKFHQTLHIPWNLLRHGSMLNADGHHPESIAKKTVKDPASHTQRQKSKLSHQTGKRYIESLTMSEYCRLSGAENTKYINPKTKEAELSRRVTPDMEPELDIAKAVSGGTNFVLSIDYDNGDDEPLTSITWVGKGKKPMYNFDHDMLQQLGRRLFYPDDGGRIDDNVVPGFSCLTFGDQTFGDQIFRGHPHFNCDHPWHDWVYVQWDGYDEAVPARIEMFLDLRHSNITNERNGNDEYSNDDQNFSNKFLERKLYAVVWSAISNDINQNKLNQFHLPLTIGYRVEMEVTRRIVPVESFCAPCYAYLNACGIGGQMDYTAVVLLTKQEWANEFLSLTS